jgi:hypothetical protein
LYALCLTILDETPIHFQIRLQYNKHKIKFIRKYIWFQISNIVPQHHIILMLIHIKSDINHKLKNTIYVKVQDFVPFLKSDHFKLFDNLSLFIYASVTLHRISLTDVQRITKFSISPCPFRMRFFSVYHAAFALLVRRCSFRSMESFECVQDLERTPSDKVVRQMYGNHALVCVLFVTRTFLILYLSGSSPFLSGGPDSRPDY